MARIDFLPVCGNCGTVLYGKTIDILKKGSTLPKEKEILWHDLGWEIKPLECPNCRHVFDSIAMPTKLPFNTPEKQFY